MRIDELHKFSDSTLNDVRFALDDTLKRIQMKYLPQTIWREVDRERAGAMIQAIDRQLGNKRIMMSLEKFVGGRLSILTDSKEQIKMEMERRSVKVKELQERCIITAFKLSNQERYEHVGPKVTSFTRWKRLQDGEKRLCLVDDLIVLKITYSHTS
ncbi:hypothetical protein Tco_1382689 [Tanacetum coccineum]